MEVENLIFPASENQKKNTRVMTVAMEMGPYDKIPTKKNQSAGPWDLPQDYLST